MNTNHNDIPEELSTTELQFLSSQVRARRVMWLILVLVILLGVALFYGGQRWLMGTDGPNVTAPPKGSLAVSETKLKAHVQALVDIKPARSHAHPASLNKAVAYIASQWKEMGLQSQEQPFKVGTDTYKNLIAFVGPEKGPRIVVGAHYDVCGDQPGADDNASAVAGLLELSRLLKQNDKLLTSRIEFVAYTLEEPPNFGSKTMGSAVHARSLKKTGVNVKLMISLEMIGFFSDKPGSQRYPIPALSMYYPTKGNFIAVVGNQSSSGRSFAALFREAMRVASPLPVYSLNAPSSMTGVDFSDHRNYWTEGYPALMITDTAFFRNPHYHKVTDTIDTLNFSKMADVVRGVYWSLRQL